jgi:hypothetical protein
MDFSSANGLTAPEACRCLIALAVNEMDVRYYLLVRQLAEVLDGGSEFGRACAHVKAMVDGAALAAGRAYINEPERSNFILKIVQEALAQKGKPIEVRGLWFADATPASIKGGQNERSSTKSASRKIRTIRKLEQDAEEESKLEDDVHEGIPEAQNRAKTRTSRTD